MGFQVDDLDQEKAWAPSTLLEAGWHRVRIAEATDGTSSGGYPQVELRLENENGDIRDWLVYTPATKGKFRQVLDAVGIVPGSGSWQFPTNELIGKPVGIKVGDEPDYNDPTKNRRRVQAYVPPSDVKSAAQAKEQDDLPF